MTTYPIKSGDRVQVLRNGRVQPEVYVVVDRFTERPDVLALPYRQDHPLVLRWEKEHNLYRHVGGHSTNSSGRYWLQREDAPVGTRAVDLFVTADKEYIVRVGNVVAEGRDSSTPTQVKIASVIAPRGSSAVLTYEVFPLTAASADAKMGYIKHGTHHYPVDLVGSDSPNTAQSVGSPDYFRKNPTGTGVLRTVTAVRAAVKKYNQLTLV